MIITPHLGIGDLLLCKMKEISNNLSITHVNINRELVEKFCDNYNLKVKSTTELIKLLFPNATYCVNNTIVDFSIINSYSITNPYIYNNIDSTLLDIENKYSNYIVFHTKMRHDGIMSIKFDTEIKPMLEEFFKNFKTNKTIILLGEKNIGNNYETRIHNTQSIYIMLSLLSNNNNVIDLTMDILTSGNNDFQLFMSDINIINKAICNITFGIGGPFNICKAFSKNNVSFIPFSNLSPYTQTISELTRFDSSLVENTEELADKIESFINIESV